MQNGSPSSARTLIIDPSVDLFTRRVAACIFSRLGLPLTLPSFLPLVYLGLLPSFFPLFYDACSASSTSFRLYKPLFFYALQCS